MSNITLGDYVLTVQSSKPYSTYESCGDHFRSIVSRLYSTVLTIFFLHTHRELCRGQWNSWWVWSVSIPTLCWLNTHHIRWLCTDRPESVGLIVCKASVMRVSIPPLHSHPLPRSFPSVLSLTYPKWHIPKWHSIQVKCQAKYKGDCLTLFLCSLYSFLSSCVQHSLVSGLFTTMKWRCSIPCSTHHGQHITFTFIVPSSVHSGIGGLSF